MTDLQIDNWKDSFVFVVIPFLSTNVILGNDWNLHSGLIVDYNKREIYTKDKRISNASVLFEKSTSDRILLSKKDDITMIYLIESTEETEYNNNNNNRKSKINQNKIAKKPKDKDTNDEDIIELGRGGVM